MVCSPAELRNTAVPSIWPVASSAGAKTMVILQLAEGGIDKLSLQSAGVPLPGT
jgi:hypothetical protein